MEGFAFINYDLKEMIKTKMNDTLKMRSIDKVDT